MSINVLYLVDKYPDKPWDWSMLSKNKNITLKDILDRPDKPWNWSYLSYKSKHNN